MLRTVGIKELANIIKDQQIKPRSKKDGEQRGEFGITLNKEYAVNNIIYSTANKNKKGKLADKDAMAASYTVLIEIKVKKGTAKMLEEKYGRKFSGQEDHEKLAHINKVAEDNERNIIEMKIEKIKGSDKENINYMIKSKSPGDIKEGDPLFDLNNSIVKVNIIGGIVPSSSLVL